MTRCYQCVKEVDYAFGDSRCWRCTRLTPEEVRGEVTKEVVSPEDLGHMLWTDDQLMGGERPDILVQMVVENGLAVCKKCNEFEAGLDVVCARKQESMGRATLQGIGEE